ncbi:FmdB family zinc ribbon protein [Silvibacterium sp.]|uniref:FmdB family zinc ribbon protein n=1 Tax=Silvibacterium sp. TaxID=1964179 RepID=UPI0039E34235
MPLYEYRCTKCGHQFEKIQSFSAEPLTECPVCQGLVERLISAPAVQFKGSGWYVTDYAGKSASAKPSASSASAGSSESSSSSSTESKAAPSAPASSTGSSSKSE